MNLPKTVELIEVGPRDGLQNISTPISTNEKKELIQKLSGVGFKRIETTSFVHPKWVPQMADAEEIAHYCNELGIEYIALTPNSRSLQRAIESKVKQIAVFVGASTQFNQKNINRTTRESLDECTILFGKAKSHNMYIRAYVSMAFNCPYQGQVSFSELNNVCRHFIEIGSDEIVIGDTNGHANPRLVYERFVRLKTLYPDATIVGHFHDTRKMGLANMLAAITAGIERFDTSIGGLGGCPFSPGATGNLATEDAVLMLHEMGVETGIDYSKLLRVIPYAKSLNKEKT